MLLSTASLMAQRSYNSGDYFMAKKLLDQISISYRHEGWRSILTTILLTALDCAIRTQQHRDAMQYSMELLGGQMLVTPAQKAQIHAQMMSLVHAGAVAPKLPPAGSAANDAAILAAPAPFDCAAHVFDVDRKHGILSASSHFLTVPESTVPSLPSSMDPATGGTPIPVSNARDPFVCVQEEFDLLLTIGVGFPAPVTFRRLDVYFYAPTAAASNGTAGGAAANGGHPAQNPYHLVILGGGAASPVFDAAAASRPVGINTTGPSGALGGPPLDRDLPILRPDASGAVRADLSFPGVHGLTAGSAGTSKSGSNVANGAGGVGGAAHGSTAGGGHAFTFSFLPPATPKIATSAAASAGIVPGAQASRSFRVRMKATQATTTQSATLGLPIAGGAAGSASAPPSSGAQPNPALLHIPGSNQALFVMMVVASLAAPAPAPSPSVDAPTALSPTPKSLQLKVDVFPSRHEDPPVPLLVQERTAADRKEKERRAKKKGITLPVLLDVSLDPTIPARTPILRILPQHARAHIGLLHPGPALVGEYFPLQVRLVSDGDEIHRGELSIFASIPPAASSSAAPAAVNPLTGSAASTPTAGGGGGLGGLTPSSSMDVLTMSKASTDGSEIETTRSRGASASIAGADAPPLASSPPTPDPIKFFRLVPAMCGIVGRPPVGVSSFGDELFEELAPGSTIPVPEIAAGASHSFTIFLKATTPLTPAISFTLAYTNRKPGASGAAGNSLPPATNLAVTTVLTTLVFKQPFKVRCKVFSDALSGMPPAGPSATAAGTPSASGVVVSASTAQRLILQNRVLMHVEIENMSGNALHVDEIGLDLSGRFFRNHGKLVPGQTINHVLRECISPAAAAAIKEAEKIQSIGQGSVAAASASASPASATTPCVALSPGEKYTHLFSFTPIVPGKTRYTPLHLRWNRITPIVSPPPPTAAPVVVSQRKLSVAEEEDEKSEAAAAAHAAANPPLASLVLAPPSPPSPLLFPTPSILLRKDLLYFLILKSPLGVKLVFPPSASFGETFPFEVRVENPSEQMHDVEVTVLDAEGPGAGAAGAAAGAAASSQTGHASLVKCVLSGKTRGLVRIRPLSTASVVYRVCPLECGAISLPRIQLRAAGLTTLSNANAAPSAGAGASTTPSSQSSSQQNQSVLLMDPNDVGMVFVHPKPKTSGAEAAQ